MASYDKQINVRLDHIDHDKITSFSRKSRRSMSALVRDLLHEGLKAYERKTAARKKRKAS